MLEAVRNAYAIVEQLNIGMTGLIVIGLILSLAFLFSVREAASWFFKINDLKKDIQRLREVTKQLETEIKSLQNVAGLAKQQAQLNIVPPIPASQNDESEKPMQKSASFPIVH